jgi:hypothetical protein
MTPTSPTADSGQRRCPEILAGAGSRAKFFVAAQRRRTGQLADGQQAVGTRPSRQLAGRWGAGM